MLASLCSRHWDLPQQRIERLQSEVCPACLFEAVRRAERLVERAAEKIRRLEWVREAAARYRSDPASSPKDLDEALRASQKRPESPDA